MRRGPKIKPCGTSLSRLAKLESTPETEKICLRSDKLDLSQLFTVKLV